MLLNAKIAGQDLAEGRSDMVLLHGLFGAAGNLGVVQRRFADARWVLALDLRNHGDSPHADGMQYGAMARDVADTMDAHGGRPAVLVGHSMGGKVAMRTALDMPERVAALVVSDIAPVRYPPHFRAFAAAMRALPVGPGLGRREADAALAEAIPDPAVRGFLLQNLRTGAEPRWRIGLDQIRAGLPDIEGWEYEGRYDGPCLFVTGTRSDYVRPEHESTIRRLFPRVRFASVEAGHWVHADDPNGFNAAVAAFLQDL